MEHVITIKLFYPMLFATIIVLGIITGLVIVKCKDSKLFQNIFTKSSDNAKEITIDTTSKMKDMHAKATTIPYTEKHEKELHNIEIRLTKVEKDIIEINEKLSYALEQIIKEK